MRGRLSILAIVLIALNSGTLAASSTPVAQGTFAIADSKQTLKFVAALRDSSPAVWREAAIRLAVAGPRAIDAITSAGLAHDARMRSRLKPLLSMALLNSITPEELDRAPALRDLAAAEIAQGFAVAETLAAFGEFDLGEPTLSQILAVTDRRFPVRGSTEAQRAIRAARALGGFMVPAALRLCVSPQPVARAYGAWLLRDVAALSERLAPLRTDTAPVAVRHDDYSVRKTIAEIVSDTRAGSSVGRPASDAFENVLTQMDIVNGAYDGMFDLINTIRQTSRATEATSWDGWWNEARPAWERWWALSGEGLRPRDRDEWFDFQNAIDGFRLRRHAGAQDRVALTLEGPPNTHCRIYQDSLLVASGQVPLNCALRAAKGEEELALSIRVSAVFADGRAWEQLFSASEGESWELTLITPTTRPR